LTFFAVLDFPVKLTTLKNSQFKYICKFVQNNRTSGSKLLAKERSTSRLYDPAYSKDYQHIKDNLSCGDVEDWDVTTLVFALNYLGALSGIRFGYRWRIQNAIYQHSLKHE